MGCWHRWADERQMIMEMSLEAPWALQEFIQHAQDAFVEIKAKGMPCATMVDVTRIGALPKGNVMRYLNEIENMMPGNVFASAIIGAPYVVNVFMDILMRMRPHAQRVAFFARSREEAVAKINTRYAQQYPAQTE